MFMVATVIESNLVVQVQRRYRDEFHVDSIPSFDITLEWAENFWNTSSVLIIFLEVHHQSTQRVWELFGK